MKSQKAAADCAELVEIAEETLTNLDFQTVCTLLPEEKPRLKKGAVREVREILKVSQSVLARLLGVSPAVVRAWEHGHSRPSGAATRLLQIALQCPGEFAGIIFASASDSSRLKLKVSK